MLRTTKQCFLKFSLLFAAIFLPFSALSQNSHSTMMRKPSVYMDVGLGINIFNSPVNDFTSGRVNAAGNTGFLRQSGRMVNSSTAVELAFGYISPLNRWFSLGLRFFANYAVNQGGVDIEYFNRPFLRQTNNTATKLRQFEYGVDLTPTATIGVNQFFSGIFGIAVNRTQIINVSGADATDSSPTLTSPEERTIMNRSVTGLRLGYQLEELLSRNVSLYMSYIWTGYESLSLLQNRTFLAFFTRSNIKYQAHKVMLGLRFYFAPQHYQAILRSRANYFNRFYLSIAFGNLIPEYHLSGDTNMLFNTGATETIFANSQEGAAKPIGVIGLGYGFLIHHFYLGIETLLNIADGTSKSESDFFDTASRIYQKNISVKLNTFEGAADLKYGFLVAPETLLIARTGIGVNFVTLNNFQGGNGLEINQNEHKTVAGLRFGLGIEKRFSNNLAMVVNYVYTYYGHVSAEETVSTVGSLVMTSSANARVATHAATIGINYYFS